MIHRLLENAVPSRYPAQPKYISALKIRPPARAKLDPDMRK